MNTVAEKTAIAKPLLSLPNMSAKMAAVTASGQLPNSPAKNLHIMIVWRFAAVATAMVKSENPRAAIRMGIFRP